MMIDFANLELWFVTGSQHLYGQEVLKTVEEHSSVISRCLSDASSIPVKVVAEPVMTSGESIHQLCLDANNSKRCIGGVRRNLYRSGSALPERKPTASPS